MRESAPPDASQFPSSLLAMDHTCAQYFIPYPYIICDIRYIYTMLILTTDNISCEESVNAYLLRVLVECCHTFICPDVPDLHKTITTTASIT